MSQESRRLKQPPGNVRDGHGRRAVSEQLPSVLILLIGLALPTVAWAQDAASVVRLWEEPAPGAQGDAPEDVPAMYVYAPEGEKANGAAVLVFPGGGYYVHAIDHEGAQVARRLNRFGVTAFVVRYRLKPAGYDEYDAFVDARRAVRLVRARADTFGIDPARVGVLGFSAGGHLATALGVNHDAGDAGADDPVERLGSRPDFVVSGYGVPAPLDEREGRAHGRREVTADTPPTFLWITSGDERAPDNAAFYQMLQAVGVDAELHVFGGWGPHGLGLAPGEPLIGTWPDLLETWMRRRGFLTPAPRLAVAGRVTIDGAPLHRGWIHFIPDDPNAPVASDYVTHEDDGRFEIAAAHGPVAGSYRVEVVRVATAFLPEPSMEDAERFDGPRYELAPGLDELTIELTGPGTGLDEPSPK